MSDVPQVMTDLIITNRLKEVRDRLRGEYAITEDETECLVLTAQLHLIDLLLEEFS